MANTLVPIAQPISEEQFSGMEIEPYIGHDNLIRVNSNQLQMIIRDLKNQIFRSIKEMKALNKTKLDEEISECSSALAIVPLSVICPVVGETTPNQTPKRRGRKTTTRIIGDFFVSYQLPQICVVNNINLDSATLYEEQLGDVNNCRQYSTAERLEDWSLQLRERSNGMHDVYYYHTRSSRSFRSAKEVVNFIVFEMYPKPRTKPDNVAEVDMSEIQIASSSSRKKKKCHEGQDGKKNQVKKDKAMDSSATHSGSSTKKEETDSKGRDNEMKQVTIDKATIINFFLESSRNLLNLNLNVPKDSSKDAL